MADSSPTFAARLRLLVAAVLTLATGRHHYLSTGCLHGEHVYCRSMIGAQGTKRPAQCKFCLARCRCRACHVDRDGDRS